MEKRIDARLSALYDALERRRMEQEAPVDALSQSLYEWGQELSGLDDDEKGVVLTDGIPGNPNKTIVSEPGLYSLVLGSRKPISFIQASSSPQERHRYR